MIKIIRSLVASLIFFLVLMLVYYVHILNFKVNVIFYSAVADGFIATVIVGAGLLYFRYFNVLDAFEKFQIVMIWLLVGYSFAISVPTVVDRSLSFYILEKLQQRGGGIKQKSFEQIFKEEYMREHRLVDVRLTEQLESGTIMIENGCVKLTDRGYLIASFSRYFRKHLLPKNRLLMGAYSDDLTDPFANSYDNKEYICR